MMAQKAAGRNRSQFGTHKKRVYLIVTAVVITLLGIVAAIILHQTEENQSRDYLLKARESYSEGDYEGALMFLRRVEDKNAEDEVLLLMADCYEAMGNYQHALDLLRRLNTTDAAIVNRIQTIEQEKAQINQQNSVTVAGISIENDARSASLDSMGITDAQLTDIASLYALDVLSLQDNQITDIRPLCNLGGLDELNLAGNQIQDIDEIVKMKGLRTLSLDRNPIRSIAALGELDSLNILSLAGTEIEYEDLYTLSLRIPQCAIRFTEDDTIAMMLAGDSFLVNIEELSLDGRGIVDISALSEFTELRILDLSNNDITDLRPIMMLSKLERLSISGNAVSDLRPLIGLPLLSKLDAANNIIDETNSVGSIVGLEELNLSGNPILDYNGIGKLDNLIKLNLAGTGISDSELPFLYPMKQLQYLDLQNNIGLSDKAVGALKSALTGCNVVTSELVYEVDFSGHLVRSDEKKLSFPCCGISDLSGLTRMTRLDELDLSGNEITGLYQFEISPSRLSLRKLNLAKNQISDVYSLSFLTGIEELDLSGNRIESVVSLQQLRTLKTLNLSGNPLTLDSVAALKSALPDCSIVFEIQQ